MRFVFIYVLMVVSAVYSGRAFSQGLLVKEFKQNLSDGSAFHAPQDVGGHPCGLIKVRTGNPDLRFKGDIVGEVENKMNEYWVYVSQSCSSLKIIHPNYLPNIVSFADYGINISPKATYVLTLEEKKYKKEKTGLTVLVKPEDANLYINDIYIDNISNGYYQLYLPKGEYVCRTSKVGYSNNVQIIQTGKSTQTLSVELESLMAELEVKCKTSTAEIYIDGEKKGNGSWKGAVLAGEHQIEAKQQHYQSSLQKVSIAERESKTLVVPELKRSMGKWEIITIPNNLPIIIDGKNLGNSPLTLDIESGKHYAMCKSFGCSQERIEVNIDANDKSITTINLDILGREGYDRQEVYREAYAGKKDAIVELVCLCLCGVHSDGNPTDPEEAVFWIKRFGNDKGAIEQWVNYRNKMNTVCGYDDMIHALCESGDTENALYVLSLAKLSNQWVLYEFVYRDIGDAYLNKKEYDKAISCYEKAEKEGYEGLGDCYKAKGNKQLAVNYYRKCLNLDYYDGKNRVEKKLKKLNR
jgi:hypothetical protein